MNQPQFWIRFVLAVLATWRITHLLAHEDGPADLIVKLRAALGNSLAGALRDCFKCLSLWIAAPAALFVAHTPLDWLFAWLALSGAACLLQRLVPEPAETQPFPQASEGEVSHVLWSETSGPAERPSPGEELKSREIGVREAAPPTDASQPAIN
jgi:hypothetical protein